MAATQASAMSAQASIWRLPHSRAGLDRGLGGVERLGEPPADLQRVREADHHRDHELALAGRARDRDAAAQVADRVVVALAEELGEAEVVGRVEAAGERAVVERVERRGGLGARRLGGVRPRPAP